MSQKKYQVFVSSTFRDLIEERQDAIRNILDLKHIPAGMELFPASDVDQLDYIKKVIDECDYYLLIMGGRYGSIDADGVSFTEREYDYAVETGKVVIAFVHSNPDAIPVGKSDLDPKVIEALKGFRGKVMTGRLVKTWATRQELEPLVLKSLIHAFNDFPQVGWIRGDNAATDVILEQSNKVLQENVRLREELSSFESRNIVDFDDIATLDDVFTVRVETSNYIVRRGTQFHDRTIELTWRQIFVALAGVLDKARTDDAILTAVKEAANEIGFQPKISSINHTDKVTIKIQLEALGLLNVRVSKTVKGGVAEFLFLTPNGRQLFVQNRVVRK
ncbi:DUF4062 domain-containing protein [Roseibium litorale]|uniref:DUF4062 domain-containing protein n=1 Tax=Roseibium litorale TaxID=2803841 RepID=A0ABR9CT08_9HYPH|nr:DUF4062 domain-containing protein [Roseibium litorale]MBD8894017.1 DUF4062 domain-containing protein [Roseibium litorale]